MITPPATAVFTTAEAKAFLREDGTAEDTLVARLVASATARAETYLRRRLITQTVQLRRDCFPGASAGIVLPIAPVASISKVDYTDGAGATQTLASSKYRLVTSRLPAELHPTYGNTWPVTRNEPDAVAIDLVVGYGAAGSDVPADILAAIRLDVAHMFEHREAVVIGAAAAQLPLGVRSLLDPHILWI